MKEKPQCDKLLYKLAVEMGLHYLSDLRFIEGGSKLHKAVSKIPLKHHSYSEWKIAAQYIGSGIHPSRLIIYSNAEDARNALLKR